MPSEEVGELIELSYSIDLIDEDSTGKTKIIKKNLKVKKLVYVSDIKNPTQVFTKKGIIIKNKCRILLKDEGELVIDAGYEEIKNLLSRNHPTPQQSIGFKLKNKK